MKRFLFMLLVCVCATLVAGCINQEVKVTEQSDPEGMVSAESVVEKTDYEDYTGNWSVSGADHDSVITDGGAEMSCSIENGNEFSGHFFTQQGGTERFAFIDAIEGVIENNELLFRFTDDGWGGSGVLHLVFGEDKITAEIQDYQMAEDNLTGYGVNGSYEMVRTIEEQEDMSSNVEGGPSEMTYEEMAAQFCEQFYAGLSEEELERRAEEGASCYFESEYADEIVDYWEHMRGVTDISNRILPLYFTGMKYYSEDTFQNDPEVVIHLAKNEIYAMHGYIFRDEALNDYFRGCMWYRPVCGGEEFDDSVFNDYERKNLELLSALEQQF